MGMTEITTEVVHVSDFSGSDGWLSYEEWEKSWQDSRYAYLGKCIVAGDTVGFSGDLKAGDCYIVAGGEVVFSRSWYSTTTDDPDFLNWLAEQ